jgi:hypothetical protein
MERKLKSPQMQQWDWLAYMSTEYPRFPFKNLFDDEHAEMLSPLLRAQGLTI